MDSLEKAEQAAAHDVHRVDEGSHHIEAQVAVIELVVSLFERLPGRYMAH